MSIQSGSSASIQVLSITAGRRQIVERANENAVELALIALMFIAVGALAVSALRRVLEGVVQPRRCSGCGRVVGRAYSHCRHCGAEL